MSGQVIVQPHQCGKMANVIAMLEDWRAACPDQKLGHGRSYIIQAPYQGGIRGFYFMSLSQERCVGDPNRKYLFNEAPTLDDAVKGGIRRWQESFDKGSEGQ